MKFNMILKLIYRQGWRKLLVIFQLILAMVVISNSYEILVLSINKISRSTGINEKTKFAVSVDPISKDNTYTQISLDVAALSKVSGITNVSSISVLPFQRISSGDTFYRSNTDKTDKIDGANVSLLSGGVDFLNVLGVSITQGRDFKYIEYVIEEQNSPTVVIITKALSDILFGNESPLGKFIYRSASSTPMEIVGVVDKFHGTPGDDFESVAFLPNPTFNKYYMFTSTIGDSLALEKEIKDTLVSLSNDRVISDVISLSDLKFKMYNSERVISSILALVDFIAILITFIAVYASVNSSVNKNTKQIGIRRAIGETKSSVILSVFLEYGILAFMALIIGSFTSIVVNSYFHKISKITELSLETFIFTGLWLFFLVLISCIYPAVKAISITPMSAINRN